MENPENYLLFNYKNYSCFLINKIAYEILCLSKSISDASEIAKTLGLEEENVAQFMSTLIKYGIIKADYRETEKRKDVENKIQISASYVDLTAPIRVAWLITRKCNLMCRHCYFGAGPSLNSHELSFGCVKNLLQKVADAGVFIIYYTGGEPFVRKDFMEILKLSSDLGLKIGISTNGLLLNENNIEKITQLSVIKVQVSLDGASKGTHEFIRGSNTFERTVSNIKKLVESNIDTGITFVCHKGNIRELEDIIRLGMKLRVKGIKISPLMSWGRARDLRDYCYPNFEDRVRLIETVSSISKKLGIGLLSELHLDVGKPDEDENPYGCPLVMGLTLLPNADVIPCEVFAESLSSKILLGNLINQDITEMWNSPKARMFRDLACVLNKKACSSCSYLRTCGSYCLAEVYLKYKELTPPSGYFKECKMAWKSSLLNPRQSRPHLTSAPG